MNRQIQQVNVPGSAVIRSHYTHPVAFDGGAAGVGHLQIADFPIFLVIEIDGGPSRSIGSCSQTVAVNDRLITGTV
ncbi:hypothetical protein D3C76_1455450 [compost metagenome]